MITIGNITAKTRNSGLGKLRVSSPPAKPIALSPWGSVLTLINQAVQQVRLEMKAARSDLDGPDREYIDGSAERLLVNYADRLYVHPFYCVTPPPREIHKELSRVRPLDPVNYRTRRHCTKIPTFGLWYMLPGKLKEKAAALDAQRNLLTQLRHLAVSYSLPNRTQTVGLETTVEAAGAALEMMTSMSDIGFASLESAERGAVEAFMTYMTAHFSALQAACNQALDELNPESAFPVTRSRAWAGQITNWEKRTPRKERIL